MSLPWGVLVFLVVVPGLGLLTARFLRLAPQDRLTAIIPAGIILLGLGGQLLHVLGAGPAHWRVLTLAALLSWTLHWREAASWWRCRASRRLLWNWLIVTAGCLGALAFIRTYSGGDWIGDWVGHYHRAHYFLHQDPAELWIFALDPFTARPPLLNLATAALMAQGDDSFAAYQVYTTLLGTVAVLPLCRLVVAAGGRRRSLALVPLLLLVNPLFVQNATYSWTKLGAAAFVLTAAWFFRRGMASGHRRHWEPAAVAFSAAVLAHYSSAPYALAGIAAFLWLHRARWGTSAFWLWTARLGAGALALAATWFGWAVARSGLAATVLANTTVTQAGEQTAAVQLRSFAANLWHTVLPPPWPGADMAFLQVGDAWTAVRDHVFVFVQTCLPGMAGFGGFVVLLWLLARLRTATVNWLPAAVFVAAIVVVGVAVHPGRMRWGAGHICLQPLALGLAAVVIAVLPRLPPVIRRLAVAGWLADAVLGVWLHLFIGNRQVHPTAIALGDGEPLRAMYGLAFGNNAAAKYALGLELLGDRIPLFAAAGLLLAALVAATVSAGAASQPRRSTTRRPCCRNCSAASPRSSMAGRTWPGPPSS
jgi:hypothetical protein